MAHTLTVAEGSAEPKRADMCHSDSHHLESRKRVTGRGGLVLPWPCSYYEILENGYYEILILPHSISSLCECSRCLSNHAPAQAARGQMRGWMTLVLHEHHTHRMQSHTPLAMLQNNHAFIDPANAISVAKLELQAP